MQTDCWAWEGGLGPPAIGEDRLTGQGTGKEVQEDVVGAGRRAGVLDHIIGGAEAETEDGELQQLHNLLQIPSFSAAIEHDRGCILHAQAVLET